MSTLSKKLMLCLCLLPLLLPGRLLVLPPADRTLDIHTAAADARQVDCLARNIYHESRGEPFWGQVAVAQVTLNRAKHKLWPSNLCAVVYQHAQFSWTLAQRKPVRDTKAWRESMIIARAVLRGTLHIPNFHATHFHTKQVKPRWHRSMQVVATIGNHIFYH